MNPTNAEIKVIVNVPTPARLVLVTDGGFEVAASAETIAELGYVSKSAAYERFRNQLERALGVEDLEDAPEWANTVRYMAECALFYDHDFDYVVADPDSADGVDAQRLYDTLRTLRASDGEGGEGDRG